MTPFLELERGANPVRLLTLPHQYYAHENFVPIGGKHFEQKQMCPAPFGEPCDLCERSHVPSRRWIVGALSRRFDQMRLLDIGYDLFACLRAMHLSPNWGTFEEYDIDLHIKDSDPAFDKYAQVIPYPKCPLNELELEISKTIDSNELIQLTSPKKVDMNHQLISLPYVDIECY